MSRYAPHLVFLGVPFGFMYGCGVHQSIWWFVDVSTMFVGSLVGPSLVACPRFDRGGIVGFVRSSCTKDSILDAGRYHVCRNNLSTRVSEFRRATASVCV